MRWRLFVAVMLCLPLCGCSLFTNWAKTESLKPVIALPHRPVLEPLPSSAFASVPPDAKAALQRRDAQLKDAIERHRKLIEMYNTWAATKNKKAGFGDPTVFTIPDTTERATTFAGPELGTPPPGAPEAIRPAEVMEGVR
jgi:hypothetical protein